MTEKTNFEGSSKSPEHKGKWYSNKEFWIGFGGWFGVNGITWAFALIMADNEGFLLLLFVWPALILGNIGALIYFAFKNRLRAFGLLCAFAINFLMLLVRGMAEQVICFNPFFIDLGGI